MTITSILRVGVVLAFAVASTVAQNEFIRSDKIGPGKYGEIVSLRLSGDDTVQVQAGQNRQFRVLSTVMGRYGVYREVVAPTKWSVIDAKGVSVDDKGKLTVSETVGHGARFKVTAKVTLKEDWAPKGYEQTIEQNVIVYDAKQNPLIGVWSQVSMKPCDGKLLEKEEIDAIERLEFRADGSYSVAVKPFEVYRDFWGIYSIDTANDAVTLTVAGGNHTPATPTFQGKYTVVQNVLTLTGMQLNPNLAIETPCETQFNKLGQK